MVNYQELAEHFRNTLSTLMKEKGIKQGQLASMVGVAQSQVSNWLNGRNLPNFWTVRLLAEQLGVCVSEFFWAKPDLNYWLCEVRGGVDS